MRNYSQEQKDRLMKMFSTMLDEGQDDIIWTEAYMENNLNPLEVRLHTTRYRIRIRVEEDEDR